MKEDHPREQEHLMEVSTLLNQLKRELRHRLRTSFLR